MFIILLHLVGLKNGFAAGFWAKNYNVDCPLIFDCGKKCVCASALIFSLFFYSSYVYIPVVVPVNSTSCRHIFFWHSSTSEQKYFFKVKKYKPKE